MPDDQSELIDVCPFTIVVDVNESAPFPFMGLRGRKSAGSRPLVVRTVKKALWATERRDVEVDGERHSVGLADYSIDGAETRIQIERKSIPDLFGTLGSRRGRFEAEIRRLHEDAGTNDGFAAVVVEGDWSAILSHRGHGPSPSSVVGTIVAWMQRYPRTHWILCPTRAAAERITFRVLERFWADRLSVAAKTDETHQPNGHTR